MVSNALQMHGGPSCCILYTVLLLFDKYNLQILWPLCDPRPGANPRSSPIGRCVQRTGAKSVWASEACRQGIPLFKGNNCNPQSLQQVGFSGLPTPPGEGSAQDGPVHVVHMEPRMSAGITGVSHIFILALEYSLKRLIFFFLYISCGWCWNPSPDEYWCMITN